MAHARGFTAYVQANDRRSLALFLGFLLALHVGAVVLLFQPLNVYDPAHAPGHDPMAYMLRYAPVLTLGGAALFAVKVRLHVDAVRGCSKVRDLDEAAERRLSRLLEPLAIAIGLPVPDLGVIENPALNAFACGSHRADALVVVTRGLLEGLDDEELAGVLAHELVHIRNGDIRLMAVAHTMLRGLTSVDRVNRWRLGGFWSLAVFAVFLPTMLPILLAGRLLNGGAFRLGVLSRLLIASARERIADAEAARLTQNPAALISALGRIEGRGAIPDLPREIDAMMIASAVEGASAAHPAIADRIAALRALAGPMAVAATRRNARQAPGQGPHVPPAFGRRNTPAFAQLAGQVAGQVAAEAARLRAETDRETDLHRHRPTWSGCLLAAALLLLPLGIAWYGLDRLILHALRPIEQIIGDLDAVARAVHRDTLLLTEAAGAGPRADAKPGAGAGGISVGVGGSAARDDGGRAPDRVISHEENCRRALRRPHPPGEVVDCRGVGQR